MVQNNSLRFVVRADSHTNKIQELRELFAATDNLTEQLLMGGTCLFKSFEKPQEGAPLAGIAKDIESYSNAIDSICLTIPSCSQDLKKSMAFHRLKKVLQGLNETVDNKKEGEEVATAMLEKIKYDFTHPIKRFGLTLESLQQFVKKIDPYGE